MGENGQVAEKAAVWPKQLIKTARAALARAPAVYQIL